MKQSMTTPAQPETKPRNPPRIIIIARIERGDEVQKIGTNAPPRSSL